MVLVRMRLPVHHNNLVNQGTQTEAKKKKMLSHNVREVEGLLIFIFICLRQAVMEKVRRSVKLFVKMTQTENEFSRSNGYIRLMITKTNRWVVDVRNVTLEELVYIEKSEQNQKKRERSNQVRYSRV
jgi:hypothetical protein